ncbi:aKG-HExxH-type peptide beta-hydroxylase [Janthinobacterium fluminis]|uniref:HEXXH motif-containing putative peptide modification protein n=1 Tax=Janthinobacterium fluminis TaxID=2987524 RepID=A0ABT5K029_9BURK|nr:HEXXH motif-containing putative peptide modification protein [Janthinobacterium fluminis]MDC8758315.1 HEXXH motif-containing putative peptide modification protein [Janthinobacterium fluminis]
MASHVFGEKVIRLIVESAAPLSYRPNANLDVVAAAFHAGVMKRLSRAAAGVPVAEALARYCGEMMRQPWPTTSSCWQPEVGATLQRIHEGKPLEAALQALFALHALRIAGTWCVELSGPVRVSMAGHIFDVRGKIDVQAASGKLVILDRDGVLAPLEFGAVGGGWRILGQCAPDAGWRYARPSFFKEEGFEGSYVQPWRLPDCHRRGDDLIVDWPQQPVGADEAALAADVATQMPGVFALLRHIGPHYLSWCAPVFRGIAACPSYDAGMRISASFPSHTGVVSVAFPLSTPYLAEILVHELSHQYFLMLGAAIPLLKKRADDALYYSSFKMKQRPLSKIFLAYHATANMALFWHGLLSVPTPHTALAAEELAKLLPHTKSLGGTIAASGGLSEAGEAMFGTQRALLQERGWDA